MGQKRQENGRERKGEQVKIFWRGEEHSRRGAFGKEQKETARRGKRVFFFSGGDLKLGGSSKWGVLGGGKAERDLREEAQVWP